MVNQTNITEIEHYEFQLGGMTFEAREQMTEKNIIPLIEARMGQSIRIHSLPHGRIRAYFIRMGISEGDSAVCYERLPGGTVVLKKNRQEIAVGHKLAGEILVIVTEKERAA